MYAFLTFKYQKPMKTKKTFISLFASLMFVSCNNESTPQENLKEEKFDVVVNSIKEFTNEDNSSYNISKLQGFDFNKKKIIEVALKNRTRAYNENKECVFFENKDKKNEVVAFYVGKEYGVEKSAIFEYNIKEKVLYVTAYDLDKRKLFDIEVDTKTQVGVLTNIYTPEIQTRINGCNAAIYAAGVPWTIGFGMLNPLAGVAAATFFWALEHAVC